MSSQLSASYQKYVTNITQSGVSIYDPIEIGDPDLWIPTSDLEGLLNDGLVGMSLHGLRLRTRSKVVKQAVCTVLGYPVPKSFKRTRPRFPGQRFDTYIQKANNLQIWNEEISHTRRYVMIRVSPNDLIERVKVVTQRFPKRAKTQILFLDPFFEAKVILNMNPRFFAHLRRFSSLIGEF